MNKTFLGIGVVVLVAVVGGCFLLSDEEEKNETELEVVAVASSTDVLPNESIAETIELDLSKLQGKDRLYTEEEGRYENLSEEERRLVDHLVCHEHTPISPAPGSSCSDLDKLPGEIKIILISLYNNIAVIHISPSYSSFKGKLYIYDTNNLRILSEHNDWWNLEREETFIFKQENMALSFYKPGMSDFSIIPASKAEAGHTYLKWTGILKREFPVNVHGNVLTVNMYRHDCAEGEEDIFSGLPDKCTNVLENTKTFDLSNLP